MIAVVRTKLSAVIGREVTPNDIDTLLREARDRGDEEVQSIARRALNGSERAARQCNRLVRESRARKWRLAR